MNRADWEGELERRATLAEMRVVEARLRRLRRHWWWCHWRRSLLLAAVVALGFAAAAAVALAILPGLR